MDKVILGEGYYLEDDTGLTRPNNNQIIVGSSGTGKSVSVMLPTILNMHESSMIGTYSKAGDVRRISEYQKSMGYISEICDLTNPENSTVSFEPLSYISSDLDIENLSKSIILADPDSKNPKDIYWNDAATSLLSAFIAIVLITEDEPTMNKVLDLFDSLKIEEYGKGITTTLDDFFSLTASSVDSSELEGFNDFLQLPYATAGCVRDSLAKAFRRLFPDTVRKMMREHSSIDFKSIATRKTSLIIITSPVNKSLYLFANLLFSTAIKELVEFAEICDSHRLPIPVRLMFDDFACAAKINDFAGYISIFRASGISAMMLLQSESQLESVYSAEEATTILDNCSCYVYFPGGMNLKTCRNISQRLDTPIADIMYAPMQKVIIMQSGRKPSTVRRYDTFHSPEYLRYMKISQKSHER